MVDYIQVKLEKLGATVEQCDVGNQTLPDGKVIKLPNVIMGSLGNVSKFYQIILIFSQIEIF
jgi:nonspecific dipeptidase